MGQLNALKLIFSELRIVPITEYTQELTDENLVKAMTVNTELETLGYTLKPDDIVKLAKFGNLDTFMKGFYNLLGGVKSKPMYPDYPNQVMSMDEATFRFHQMIHYWSTYGVELFTGEDVSNGWLPEVFDTDKTEDDITLLDAKVIELYVEKSVGKDVCVYAYNKILSKKERMTDKERMILMECVKIIPIESLSITIPFKQNMLDVFYIIFSDNTMNSEQKIGMLKTICQHTGDVWKCMDYTLTKERFHFRTSQKRLLVKLVESYPISDFKPNLILSNKKGKRTNLMLQYLDYNNYSRSIEHKKVVSEFRNGELRSWESRAKYLVTSHNPKALGYICDHPGTALRMLTYLIRNGYTAQNIYLTLKPYCNELSTQTLVSICNHFSKGINCWESVDKYSEAIKVYTICKWLLEDKFKSKLIESISGKKVYLSMDEYDLNYSTLLTNNKSAEGGYIRSGIAYKIPKDIDRLRFFVYWNDEKRVDVDLHANAKTSNGKEVNIGWCSDYMDDSTGLVFSGDITHSDAAEFIDIDLHNTDADIVSFNINLYSGKPTFKDIDEFYVGCMAVGSIGEEVKLYNPKNCFFTHYLTGNYTAINYGFVDVTNRYIRFDGTMDNSYSYYTNLGRTDSTFTLYSYISLVLESQHCTIVDNLVEADVTLVMGKPSNNNEVSLIDNNFFMDI